MKELAAAAALFAVNAFITLRLFHRDYINQMGSIEGAFIGLARYIRDHYKDLTWYPLWYGGIPYPDTYPPLLHSLVAAVSGFGGISAGLAYHAVTALCYALGPVAVFWTAQRLGANLYSAFGGSLLYSLLSPSCWLAREVRVDSGGWLGPRRLQVLVQYGEGPHIISLLFLVVAIGLLHAALQTRRPLSSIAAGLAMAATVLSNWIGAFALAVAVTAYLLANFEGAWRSHWLRTAAIGVFAYAVAMPWAMPSTIRTIESNAPFVGGRFVPNVTQTLVVVALLAGALLLAWAFERFRVAPRARFGMLLFLGMAGIALPAYYFDLSLLPQPKRYHLEVDLAFCLAAMLLLRWRPAVVAGLAVLSIPLIVQQQRVARVMEKPIAIGSTAEYRVSTWLGTHMRGQRVFAPGNFGFWMNAFSDTAELTGGFDNGIRNSFIRDVIYQIYAGNNAEIALDWLKAFGCQAVVGDDPQSREVFHPYAHPERFHGLRELWRDGPEVIYEVPRARPSPAHALRAGDLLSQRPTAYYTKPMAAFLAALDDPALPVAAFEWHGMSAARITADLKPEHLLYVQTTWDKGWRATVNGQPRATRADVLGQMVIEPHCNGPCVVDLVYNGGAELRMARVVNGLALAGAALWLLVFHFWYDAKTN
jgi:hypothetical protein